MPTLYHLNAIYDKVIENVQTYSIDYFVFAQHARLYPNPPKCPIYEVVFRIASI